MERIISTRGGMGGGGRVKGEWREGCFVPLPRGDK